MLTSGQEKFLENYVLMNKTTTFVMIYLDIGASEISKWTGFTNQSESNIAEMAQNIDIKAIQKIYNITEDEMKLRNGLINGVLNQIIVRKLR